MDFDPLFNKLNDEVNKAIETYIPDDDINGKKQINASKSNVDINAYLNDKNNINTSKLDNLTGRKFFKLN